MAELTKEDLKHVANLAHLAITDEEASEFTEHLVGIMNLAEELTELDTNDVVPMTHALELINVMREDVPKDILDRAEMLKGVKEHQAGQIKVPTIL